MGLQGHISFPFILDLSPFMTTKLGIKIQEANVHALPVRLQINRNNPLPDHYVHQSERKMLELNDIHGLEEEEKKFKDVIDDGIVSPANVHTLGETMFLCNGGSSETIHRNTDLQFTGEVSSQVL